MISSAARKGQRLGERVASICDIAEPILGIDRDLGQHAWVRIQPHERLFITRDPEDSINFPNEHPLSGQPRYNWVEGVDGIRRGFLKPEATVG